MIIKIYVKVTSGAKNLMFVFKKKELSCVGRSLLTINNDSLMKMNKLFVFYLLKQKMCTRYMYGGKKKKSKAASLYHIYFSIIYYTFIYHFHFLTPSPPFLLALFLSYSFIFFFPNYKTGGEQRYRD